MYQSAMVRIMLHNRQPENLRAIQKQAFISCSEGFTDTYWGGWGDFAPGVFHSHPGSSHLDAPGVVCSSCGDDENVKVQA